VFGDARAEDFTTFFNQRVFEELNAYKEVVFERLGFQVGFN
jgi:hypothetical protein